MRIVGVLFVCGGLLLAALPPFTVFHGKALIEGAASAAGYGWLIAVFVVVVGADRRRATARGGPGVHRLGAVGGPRPEPGPGGGGARRRDARRARPHAAADDDRARRCCWRPAPRRLVPGAVPWAARASAARFVDQPRIRRVGAARPRVRWPPAPAEPRRDGRADRRRADSRWRRRGGRRSACSGGRCARRLPGASSPRRGRWCSACGACIPGISATTSPGGRRAPGCWAERACSRCVRPGGPGPGVSGARRRRYPVFGSGGGI